MEKAKLTQEQANALEAALKKESADAILKTAATDYETWFNECSPLNFVDLPTIAKALYVGYEVGEKFNPGDKVISKYGEAKVYTLSNPMVGKIAWFFMEENTLWDYEDNFRLATSEEIYWLKALGREMVHEFKKGDAVLDADGSLTRITTQLHISQAISWYRDRPEELAGIYPEESFKQLLKEDKR